MSKGIGVRMRRASCFIVASRPVSSRSFNGDVDMYFHYFFSGALPRLSLGPHSPTTSYEIKSPYLASN